MEADGQMLCYDKEQCGDDGSGCEIFSGMAKCAMDSDTYQSFLGAATRLCIVPGPFDCSADYNATKPYV